MDEENPDHDNGSELMERGGRFRLDYSVLIFVVVAVLSLAATADLFFLHNLESWLDAFAMAVALGFFFLYLKMGIKPMQLRYKLINVYRDTAIGIAKQAMVQQYNLDKSHMDRIRIIFCELTTVPPFKRPCWEALAQFGSHVPDHMLIDAYEGFIRRGPAKTLQYPRVIPAKPSFDVDTRPPATVIVQE